jgi:hypothetical protein
MEPKYCSVHVASINVYSSNILGLSRIYTFYFSIPDCTNPLPPSNGTYKTSTLYVNSTALLVCNLGYNITGNGTIQCTENGTWTHTSVKCSPIGNTNDKRKPKT